MADNIQNMKKEQVTNRVLIEILQYTKAIESFIKTNHDVENPELISSCLRSVYIGNYVLNNRNVLEGPEIAEANAIVHLAYDTRKAVTTKSEMLSMLNRRLATTEEKMKLAHEDFIPNYREKLALLPRLLINMEEDIGMLGIRMLMDKSLDDKNKELAILINRIYTHYDVSSKLYIESIKDTLNDELTPYQIEVLFRHANVIRRVYLELRDGLKTEENYMEQMNKITEAYGTYNDSMKQFGVTGKFLKK